MLATLFLLVALDSAKPAPLANPPNYDRVMQWIDTVSDRDNGSYWYLDEGERAWERRRYHDRWFPFNKRDLEPVYLPSPWMRLDWC